MKRIILRVVFAGACVFGAMAASAHPEPELDAVRMLAYRFASGLVNHNVDEVAATLAADGRFMGATRDEYLAQIRRGGDASNVLLEYATFEPIDGGIRISPIVTQIDKGTFQLAWAAIATPRDGVWLLTSLERANDFPEALKPKGLAEQVDTQPISFSLVDAKTRTPVFARISIEDEHGGYWPPRGHQKNIRVGWRQDVGGDVRIAGKTYAYVEPTFTADLPLGEYTITIDKGMEYAAATSKFVVVAEPVSQTIGIERVVDMPREGWYSGDTHVHFLDDHSALLELRAEGLNVINVLATRWGELITNVQQVTGAPSRVSLPDGIVYFNEETRHGYLGHAVLHRLKTLVYPLSWGGPSEGVFGELDYPPMAYQADKTHAQGGLVTWAHFPFPGAEAAVDIALGKIDSIDLFTWGDAFADVPSPTGNGTVAGSVSAWYSYLNTGFKLPASAGTDKMLNVQVAGSVRTYANVDGRFTYDGWLQAIRDGRTFVTTGPMVSLRVNGKPIGATLALKAGMPVEIVADVRAPFERYPIDTLEIVAGGKVIATARNDGNTSTLHLTHSFVPIASTWIAARAHGAKLLPYQVWPLLGPSGQGVPSMAHTSPIYLMLDGAPIRSRDDARLLEAQVDNLIAWAKTRAHYSGEQQRAEVVSLYERAKRVYASM